MAVPTAPAPRRRRWPWIAGAAAVVAVLAALAVGVFEVHTLWIDDAVEEEAFVFDSGASTEEAAPMATEGTPTTTAPEGTPPPEVRLVATGTFVEEGHPAGGTANLYTDGTQTVVRFEDDFWTDNGPDLKVIVHVDGQQVEVAPLKGNEGSQNYELPADIDPESVDSVGVWCKRFDYVFTTARFAA